MKEILFNEDWKFWLEKNAFALVWDTPKDARALTLPHDAMIETMSRADSPNKGNTGYHDGGIYYYLKQFHAPADYAQKMVMLKFEGIYMNSFVYINGQLAGKCPFGYSTFYVAMNDFLKYGEDNEIRIIVRNGAMTNSRWYSGGGIYRDVYLMVSDLTYLPHDGVQVKTESIESDYACLRVMTELKNRKSTAARMILTTQIVDQDERVVAADSMPVTLFAGEERKPLQRITVDGPKLWSEETPNLYQVVTKIMDGEQVIDESVSSFGIRILQADAKQGLRVNGRAVKLRGACIHHDSGLLGAATYEDAQYRQIRILKEAGFNAVRMSHHPMAQAMLRACDALGVYVMDEAFDMWVRSKSDYDYGMVFSEWWEKDVAAMVRKDYNHPSVILYSMGNEIPEIATDQGVQICHNMSQMVKSLDDTRYTLSSINGVFAAGDSIGKIMADVVSDLRSEGITDGDVNNFMSLMDKHMDKIVVHPEITYKLEKACATMDIAGYNYMTARYESDAVEYPNRIIVGSETYPPEIARNWEIIERCPHVIGDFTWTGWDYIGEAGVGVPAYNWGEGGFGATYPCRLAYCGDIDLTGFRRPASYYREIVFGLRNEPYIAVQDPNRYGQHLIKTPWVISDALSSWTWQGCEGKPVIVEVYSAGDEVALYINDRLIEKKEAGQKAGYRVLFETLYEEGRIEAVTLQDGKELGRMTLATAQASTTKKLAYEVEAGSKGELVYITLAVVDDQGTVRTDETVTLNIEVEGDAQLAGFGSGNPKSSLSYQASETMTYNGRALAILKRGDGQGKAAVIVSMDGYKEVIVL